MKLRYKFFIIYEFDRGVHLKVYCGHKAMSYAGEFLK